MILNEVLRLYSPVVLLMHCTYKEMKLGDVTLPPGAQVSLPTLLIHHDHEIWGDNAEEFKPERFPEGIFESVKASSCILSIRLGAADMYRAKPCNAGG